MKKAILTLGAAALLVLGGCGKGSPNAMSSGMHHEMHEEGASLPAGLQAAQHPAYPVGSKVTIRADHMPGMDGAEATVSGAYDTVVYAVSYTPEGGGQAVSGHRWVVQEELQGAGAEPLQPGDEAILEADHMKGMRGARATIDSAERTTVYTVDYVPTTGGKLVKNHMWVTESELAAR